MFLCLEHLSQSLSVAHVRLWQCHKSTGIVEVGDLFHRRGARTRLLELEDALLVGVLVGAPELTRHQVTHVLQDCHIGRRQLHGLAMQQAPARTSRALAPHLLSGGCKVGCLASPAPICSQALQAVTEKKILSQSKYLVVRISSQPNSCGPCTGDLSLQNRMYGVARGGRGASHGAEVIPIGGHKGGASKELQRCPHVRRICQPAGMYTTLFSAVCQTQPDMHWER